MKTLSARFPNLPIFLFNGELVTFWNPSVTTKGKCCASSRGGLLVTGYRAALRPALRLVNQPPKWMRVILGRLVGAVLPSLDISAQQKAEVVCLKTQSIIRRVFRIMQ